MHKWRLDLAGAWAYMDNEGFGIWGVTLVAFERVFYINLF